MSTTDKLIHDWQLECAQALQNCSTAQEERAALAKLGGPSPGGAAAELGFTRQRIHQLVNEGKLDLIRLRDRKTSQPHVWMITEESIARFRKSKAGVQQDLPFVKSARKVGSRASR